MMEMRSKLHEMDKNLCGASSKKGERYTSTSNNSSSSSSQFIAHTHTHTNTSYDAPNPAQQKKRHLFSSGAVMTTADSELTHSGTPNIESRPAVADPCGLNTVAARLCGCWPLSIRRSGFCALTESARRVVEL